ncbi:phage holin, partial [Bilifractor sp. LCP19S3_H10]
VTDPTTTGVSDSKQAMSYDSPKSDKINDNTKDKR